MACVSGRRALEARALVGVGELTYAGNHGLELLAPRAAEAVVDPAVTERVLAARDFVHELDAAALSGAGLRLEDKGPIQALHWRGAADEEGAERRAGEIAAAAREAGLEPRWGRKVLEVRPAVGIDKGTAVKRLLSGQRIERALYAGDDRTDLDAFGALRSLVAAGSLAGAVCIGIGSAEAPAELSEQADAVVGGTEELLGVLSALAEPASPVPRRGARLMLFVDLLRLTVLLIGGSATALGAVTVVAARQDADYTTLIFAGGWWTLAAALGIVLGGSSRAGEAMARALASARTATSLPTQSPGRIAFLRLWPIAAFAIVVGGLAWLLPPVAAVGAGFAILNALAWRNRERAVTAIEERDGVRFYVEPASALEPIKLIRTPGLGRDRMPAGHPPPPPPEAEEAARSG